MSDLRAVRTVSIAVTRSARLAMLGPEGPGVRELWYVLHGYGQLATPFLGDFRAIDDGSRLIVAPEALSRFYEGDVQTRLHRDAKVGASWMTREDRESEIADYIAYLDTAHEAILTRLGGANHAPEVTGEMEEEGTELVGEREVLGGRGLCGLGGEECGHPR